MRSSGFIAIWVLAIGLAMAAAGCVYHPSYEGTRCAAGGGCPSGYVCDNDECVIETAPDGGLDGADADAADDGDAGLDGEDARPDGTDETDGEDEGPDGTDETDGEDEGPDGAEDTPDGTDEIPACGGPCPEGQFCDQVSNQCQRCEGSEHCGLACLACDTGAGETCQNLGASGFCCLGPCDFAHACQQKDCNGTVYICRAVPPYTQPITYTWQVLETNARAIICALSDQDGMLPEHVCDAEGRRVLSWCPWYGKCTQEGTCEVDLSIAVAHDCGDMFGCEAGRCRLHRRDGQSCLYNFDCESFCCSRSNETCLATGTPADQCKAVNSRYFDIGEPRCFTAWSATPHDMGTWDSDDDWDISCADGCENGSDCDSGRCDNTLGGKRCWIEACAGGNEGSIRDNYFCKVSDNASHILSVTNQAPDPTPPDPCVY